MLERCWLGHPRQDLQLCEAAEYQRVKSDDISPAIRKTSMARRARRPFYELLLEANPDSMNMRIIRNWRRTRKVNLEKGLLSSVLKRTGRAEFGVIDTCVIHKNPPHRPAGDGEKVVPALRFQWFL